MANQVVKLKKGSDYLYPYANLNGIDTSNLIASLSNLSTSYTATQDCFAYVHVEDATIKIGDVAIMYAGGSISTNMWVILKKGQVLSATGWGQSRATTKIYGIKY